MTTLSLCSSVGTMEWPTTLTMRTANTNSSTQNTSAKMMHWIQSYTSARLLAPLGFLLSIFKTSV